MNGEMYNSPRGAGRWPSYVGQQRSELRSRTGPAACPTFGKQESPRCHGVIDAQSCSMERRRGGGVQIISTYFRVRHEVRIRY